MDLQTGPSDVVTALVAVVGLLLGIGADRLATRWPEHDEEHPPGRAVDWRTVVCAVVGAVALAGIERRFGGEPLAVAIFGAWAVTLILGLATDLDQRILPNELTLPAIVVGLVFALSGRNPLVGDEVVLALAAAVLIPAVLYLPSIPFGAGAFGLGDVKFLVGMGLFVGGERALGGTLSGLFVAGIVLVVLLATRRIGRRSYVPFGPFLIIGALWALLLR